MRSSERDGRSEYRFFRSNELLLQPSEQNLPKQQFLYSYHSQESRQEYHNVVRRDDVLGRMDF